MIRYLTLREVLRLHDLVIEQTGGSTGVRDLGALESAVGQPRASFGGQELYPTVEEKAVALGFSVVRNHPFVDGNKRVGHAAIEVFLVLNGWDVDCPVDEAEKTMLGLAAGKVDRETLVDWVKRCMRKPSAG